MTPLENQELADVPTRLYENLEEALMANIIQHIKDWEQPIASDEWLLKKLAEIGRLNKENLQIIADSTGLSMTAIKRMLNEASEKAIETIDPVLKKATEANLAGAAVAAGRSKNVQQVMKAFRSQAKDTVNMCNTNMLYMARDAYLNLVNGIVNEAVEIATKQSFLDTMNDYATQLVIGSESRHQAMVKCIQRFNARGIPAFVDKAGREWTPEAYVNMAMRNTAKNVADEVQNARCRDAGIHLIEIDAHAGARPKCAKDQGKIYDLNNGSGYTTDANGDKVQYYPWNSSSYGQPDGILGINCRHHKYPFTEGVSLQSYFPTENMEANNKLYKKTQVQRALERDVRKQKRECMIYDELEDKENFQQAAVKLKQKEEKLKAYVEGDKDLHRRKDREQVVGFGKGTGARAVAAKNKIAKEANSMYDTGSEESNIKAYYRDKPLRDKIKSAETTKTLEPGQYKKHVTGSHEYKQYQDKYSRKGEYGPSYLTIDQEQTQALVDQYAGTGILRRGSNGQWLNEEIITVHTETVGVVVNNRNGNNAETKVFKIKYSKKGTHVIPDYPSKEGTKEG